MILIADSGSTKTDWILLSNSDTSHYTSEGINPFFHSEEEIFQIAAKVLDLASLNEPIKHLFFYGAGCIKNLNSQLVFNGLRRVFKNSEIFVEDDMIGAARAVFGNKQGIACILGTGANSSKYDGSEIIEKIPPLGYILGDEASGAYFGKILINNYFKKIMPQDLSLKFEERFHPELADVLNKVYKQANPNRYLAGFSKFLAENIENPYCDEILNKGFDAFFKNNILRYSNFKDFNLGFVGSVAYHFSEHLNRVAKVYGLEIHDIIKKPIDGLARYHSITKS